MLHQHTNPIVLHDAIELLNQRRGNFEEGGLGIEEDLCILRKLYGPFSAENPPRGLPHAYLTFGTIASQGLGEGGDAFPLTATEAREEAMKSVGREISRPRRLKKHVESVESSRLAYPQSVSKVAATVVQGPNSGLLQARGTARTSQLRLREAGAHAEPFGKPSGNSFSRSHPKGALQIRR